MFITAKHVESYIDYDKLVCHAQKTEARMIKQKTPFLKLMFKLIIFFFLHVIDNSFQETPIGLSFTM